MDVPAKNKKGEYGKDCDENNVCHMSTEKLELLLNVLLLVILMQY